MDVLRQVKIHFVEVLIENLKGNSVKLHKWLSPLQNVLVLIYRKLLHQNFLKLLIVETNYSAANDVGKQTLSKLVGSGNIHRTFIPAKSTNQAFTSRRDNSTNIFWW